MNLSKKCPSCSVSLLVESCPNYNKLYCFHNHYISFWTKENEMIAETFILGKYRVRNNYTHFTRGAIISKIHGDPKSFTRIITLPEPLKFISEEKIEALIIFS